MAYRAYCLSCGDLADVADPETAGRWGSEHEAGNPGHETDYEEYPGIIFPWEEGAPPSP